MRHKSFRFAHLRLDGVPVAVHYGDLLVAQPDDTAALDWEVVLTTMDELALEPAAYDMHLEIGDGRQMWGQALLVRSDGRAHVFRGAMAINGLAADEFPV